MDKTILTIQDLSAYTGWSKSYIYKKTSDGTLKFSKPLGKTLFFSKKWIDEFLMSNENQTQKEIDLHASSLMITKKGGKR